MGISKRKDPLTYYISIMYNILSLMVSATVTKNHGHLIIYIYVASYLYIHEATCHMPQYSCHHVANCPPPQLVPWTIYGGWSGWRESQSGGENTRPSIMDPLVLEMAQKVVKSVYIRSCETLQPVLYIAII